MYFRDNMIFVDVDGDKKNMIPLGEYYNNEKWNNKDFVEIFNHWVNGLYKNEEEYKVLKTAFNMYSVSFIDVNIQERIHDSRIADPYKKALEKIKELFRKMDELAPEGMVDDEDEAENNFVIEYIENSIEHFTTTRTAWKKIYRQQSESFLLSSGVKRYRHKDIFIAFNQLMKEEI